METKQALYNFTLTLEQQRWDRCLSVKEWSRLLGVSVSGYKKIIYGYTEKIPLSLLHRLHNITGMYAFEMVQEPITEDYRLLLIYRELSPEAKKAVKNYAIDLLRGK